MYVIRNKKTKQILHMQNSIPGEERKPQEIFPGFDPETMEFGKAEEQAIPGWFTIEHGKVKPLPPPEPEPEPKLKAAPVDLEQLKAAKIQELSQRSFQLRQQLIPDHELQNAALGIYDEKRTKAIRETVKAFRDEFHRLETAVKKAKTAKQLETLQPEFPAKLAG